MAGDRGVDAEDAKKNKKGRKEKRNATEPIDGRPHGRMVATCLNADRGIWQTGLRTLLRSSFTLFFALRFRDSRVLQAMLAGRWPAIGALTQRAQRRAGKYAKEDNSKKR
jgi:hypothetical protein